MVQFFFRETLVVLFTSNYNRFKALFNVLVEQMQLIDGSTHDRM
jgi:hypothetical protein